MPGQVFVRFMLLQKRLLKKGGFLLMLCLAPLLAAGVGRLSTEPAGIATIALYLPEGDASAQEISERLLNSGILRYLLCGDEEEARTQVETGEADAAWIFPEDLSERLEELGNKRRVRPGWTGVERKDSVPLILGREILSSAIYPSFSYQVYAGYVRDELGLAEITDEELRRVYDSVAVEGSLSQWVYLTFRRPSEAFLPSGLPLWGWRRRSGSCRMKSGAFTGAFPRRNTFGLLILRARRFFWMRRLCCCCPVSWRGG